MYSFASALIVAALATLNSATPVDIQAIRARDIGSATSSVPVIFNNIFTEIQPYTEQLTYLTPSNFTVTDVTPAVSSIEASFTLAVPLLQALVGQESSVIVAPVNPAAGGAELTVSQVASIVAGDINLVLGAIGSVLDVANALGGEIVADVNTVLTDLGLAVTGAVDAATPLVNGLSTSLPQEVTSVHSAFAEFDSGGFTIILGLYI